jgi:hypothetical protein
MLGTRTEYRRLQYDDDDDDNNNNNNNINIYMGCQRHHNVVENPVTIYTTPGP